MIAGTHSIKDEDRATAYLFLGDIYRERNKWDNARDAYKQAIAVNPAAATRQISFQFMLTLAWGGLACYLRWKDLVILLPMSGQLRIAPKSYQRRERQRDTFVVPFMNSNTITQWISRLGIHSGVSVSVSGRRGQVYRLPSKRAGA